jgi:SAM-dependent methyltransferase
MKDEDIRKSVRQGYGSIAKDQGSCCGPQAGSCCGPQTVSQETITKNIGYRDEDLQGVPEGADLGLGCGNPIALASLKEGETVVDLGSGAGLDCFIAARQVGKSGKVIGIDMTVEMIERARENATKGGFDNVEFRLGEIENLPVADDAADIIISNCVINLSPDKDRVFEESYRVLKPGGRLMVSDIVLMKELPARIRQSIQAYIGCLSGADMKSEYLRKIEHTGFQDVRIMEENVFPVDLMQNDPTAQALYKELAVTPEELEKLQDAIVSIRVSAKKP